MDEIFENIIIDCPTTKMDDLIMQRQTLWQEKVSREEIDYRIYFGYEYIELSLETKERIGLDIGSDFYLYYLNFSSN